MYSVIQCPHTLCQLYQTGLEAQTNKAECCLTDQLHLDLVHKLMPRALDTSLRLFSVLSTCLPNACASVGRDSNASIESVTMHAF